MAELIDVFNAMLKNKKDWIKITDEEKTRFSFIFNRYFSKKYIEQATFMNFKGIDGVLVMDLWYKFMLTQPFPKFFFSKSDTKDKSVLTKNEYKMLLVSLKIKPDDLDYLIEKHFDFIKEELSFLVKLHKQ
jgi:hypothetical protein